MPRKPSRRHVEFGLLIIISVTAMAMPMVPGYGSTLKVTRRPLAYIISTDGSKISALNQATGKVDYTGTDPSTVINNALRALVGGGQITIKAGTYILGSRITIQHDGTYMLFQQGAIFDIANNYADQVLVSTNQMNNVLLRSITINGNGDNQQNRIYHIYANGGQNVTIVNCTITNHHGDGIHADGVNQLTIEGNHLATAKAGLATVYSPHIYVLDSTDVSVQNNYCNGTIPYAIAHQDSIQLDRCNDFRVNANTILNASDAGIEVDGQGGSSTNGEVLGNTLSDCGNYGIDVDDHITYVGVSQNLLSNFGTGLSIGGAGIYLFTLDSSANSVSYVTIDNNNLNGNGRPVSGIIVQYMGDTSNISNLDINGNKVVGCLVELETLGP